MRDHSPYLTLGIDFGSAPSLVRRAFARAARRARRDPASPLRVEDLNNALHRIEAGVGDPADRVDVYRVPADSEALDIRDTGLLRPPPIPAPRTTEPMPAGELLALAAEEIDLLVERALAARFRPEHGWLEPSIAIEGEGSS